MVLLEPFVSTERICRWARRLRYQNCLSNCDAGGKVWMFWSNDLHFEQVISSDQMLAGCFSWGNYRVLASFIYASCCLIRRRELWVQLRPLDSVGNAWFVGGDFDIVRSNEEKLGGLITSSRAKHDFNSVNQDSCLIYVSFDGPKLSWCNGPQGTRRIWDWLDLVLVNQNFKEKFPSLAMSYLDRTFSDHCPMVI